MTHDEELDTRETLRGVFLDSESDQSAAFGRALRSIDTGVEAGKGSPIICIHRRKQESKVTEMVVNRSKDLG
jgi:hypothetical protein